MRVSVNFSLIHVILQRVTVTGNKGVLTRATRRSAGRAGNAGRNSCASLAVMVTVIPPNDTRVLSTFLFTQYLKIADDIFEPLF